MLLLGADAVVASILITKLSAGRWQYADGRSVSGIWRGENAPMRARYCGLVGLALLRNRLRERKGIIDKEGYQLILPTSGAGAHPRIKVPGDSLYGGKT